MSEKKILIVDYDSKNLEHMTELFTPHNLTIITANDGQMAYEKYKEEKPDLIEIGDAYQLARIAVALAKKHDIPVVAFYHSDYPRALGNTMKKYVGVWVSIPLEAAMKRYTANLFNKMNSTLVASLQNIDILRACGVRSMEHVPIGIDTDIFAPQADIGRSRR